MDAGEAGRRNVGGQQGNPPRHGLLIQYPRRNLSFNAQPQAPAFLSSMICRSGTRKSSDANVLAVKQGFDFAQRSAGLKEVFRLPLRIFWVKPRPTALTLATFFWAR